LPSLDPPCLDEEDIRIQDAHDEVVRRLIHRGFDAARADDAAADALGAWFLAVRHSRYEERGTLAAFLETCAMRLVLKAKQRERRRVHTADLDQTPCPALLSFEHERLAARIEA
jgi:DNA-directed RNA polymerase specialized sigma24 family protein